ncbi:hypothetical protein C0993_011255, partial [Termitomyces sp. T159_Od127]
MEVKLPSLATVPILRSAMEWASWESVVTRIITSIGLRGKLSQEIQDSLPPKFGGDYDLPIRTARDLLAFLHGCFGIGSALAAEFTKAKVFELQVTPATILSYVQSWCTAVHQLSGTPWDFTPWQKIQKFVDGLPNRNKAWGIIKEDVRRSWETAGLDGLFDFDILATCVLNIAADQCRISLSNCARSSPSAPTSNITAPNSTTASSGAIASLLLSNDSSPSRPRLQCTNCNILGHSINQCWSKGGGLENGRDNTCTHPKANIVISGTERLPTPLPYVEEGDKND